MCQCQDCDKDDAKKQVEREHKRLLSSRWWRLGVFILLTWWQQLHIIEEQEREKHSISIRTHVYQFIAIEDRCRSISFSEGTNIASFIDGHRVTLSFCFFYRSPIQDIVVSNHELRFALLFFVFPLAKFAVVPRRRTVLLLPKVYYPLLQRQTKNATGVGVR